MVRSGGEYKCTNPGFRIFPCVENVWGGELEMRGERKSESVERSYRFPQDLPPPWHKLLLLLLLQLPLLLLLSFCVVAADTGSFSLTRHVLLYDFSPYVVKRAVFSGGSPRAYYVPLVRRLSPPYYDLYICMHCILLPAFLSLPQLRLRTAWHYCHYSSSSSCSSYSITTRRDPSRSFVVII